MKPFNLNELYKKIADLPPPKPLAADRECVQAMLTGIAIGDALGAPTEGMTPDERYRQFGTIRRFFGEREGTQVTDDSQMAFLTLRSILGMGEVDPTDIMRRFAQAKLRGAGKTVTDAIKNYRETKTWQTCGVDSMGNGALMRIAPVIVAHINKRDTSRLWRDVADVTILTHRNVNAVAASIAYVDMLWGFLRNREKVLPASVLQRFREVVATLQDDDEVQPRSPRLVSDDFSSFCGMALAAYKQSVPIDVACDWWYSGAYLPETLPSMLYIIARHIDEPMKAIFRAVNDTKDNDTIASLVAAAMGALYGMDAFSGDWVMELSGDLQEKGDRQMWEILKETEKIWLPSTESLTERK